MNKIPICEIGPGKSCPGGINTIINNIIQSDLTRRFQFITINSVSAKHKIWTFLKAVIKYIWFCCYKKIQCTHIHMSERGSCYRTIVFIFIAKALSQPVLVHSHGSEIEPFYNSLKGIKKRFFVSGMNLCDGIIVLTDGWRKFWHTIVSDDKIEVLPNSVALPDKFDKSINYSRELNLIFMGVIGKRKGTYILIEAISYLRKRGVKVHLTICGNGEIETAKKLVDKLDLTDRINVCGWIDGQQKITLLKESDVLVLPSIYESFGIVLLEAMSYQLPVICSDGGYMKEIVDNGIDGVIVESGSIESIACAISYFSDHRPCLGTMGANGYEKVKSRYSHAIAMKKLQDIYDKNLKSPFQR